MAGGEGPTGRAGESRDKMSDGYGDGGYIGKCDPAEGAHHYDNRAVQDSLRNESDKFAIQSAQRGRRFARLALFDWLTRRLPDDDIIEGEVIDAPKQLKDGR